MDSNEKQFDSGGGNRFIKTFYWYLRRKLETEFIGSRFQEWRWKTRHWYQGEKWIRSYQKSMDHPHRQQIILAIENFEPFESLLEVGCNSGPNLLLIHQRYPRARLIGIDINWKAIEIGKNHLRQEGIDNIELFVGRADSLDFPDMSVDIVITDAVLMFLGPEKIQAVLREMGRVAKKGLIMNEFHTATPPPDNYDGGRWVYDYGALTARLFPEASLVFRKSLFTGGQWDRYGTIMEVRF